MGSRDRFGTLLRKRRTDANYRLGEFAKALKVSTSYLSDVELGNRSPFGERILRKAARLLKCDLNELRTSAAESRGAFELTAKTLRQREVGAALMRTWERLDNGKLDQLARLTKQWEAEFDDDA